ncbi:MAG: CoA transferase [Dehalococcoidia bacterium]|nr:CoA transferase [Dehalococcoidia bacterium]
MPGPLEGVKVVEMGLWVAGPAAAAILADWGADVIKIEPPTGDPFRGLFASVMGSPASVNPPFELDNRGKRSLVLDLEKPEAREIAYQVIDRADVFITNNRPRVLEQYGLDYETLHARCPRLVYGQVTGYGPDTEARDTAAYDIGAFWSQAGIAMALTAPGGAIPQQRGGMGDHMTGQACAGAVCAALYSRERTGEGQRVSVPLVRVGVYMIGWDTMLSLRLGVPILTYDRRHAINPIIDCYQAGDGRWFWLLLLQADRHWGDLCAALGREDLMGDERFANIETRRVNAPALVDELDAVFAGKSLAEWAEAFKAHNVWWAPVNQVQEVIKDPMVRAAGAFVDVPTPDGGSVPMVATPADFSTTRWQPRGIAPELGQHTEEVLLELGYDWDRIIALKEAGAIP